MSLSKIVSKKRAKPLLGTMVIIEASGDDSSTVARAVGHAFKLIEQAHSLMSYHDQNSELSRLNLLASMEPQVVHPWVYEVISCAKLLYQASHQAFDICVGGALSNRGFLPTRNRVESPDANSDDIILTSDFTVYFKKPLTMDLGGIAKGFAVDKAVEYLKSEPGLVSAIINAGGDLRFFGDHTREIRIRHPLDYESTLPICKQKEGAVATSQNYFTLQNTSRTWGSPILDPRTGLPSRAIGCASIQAETCMIADALTKVVTLNQRDSEPVLDQFKAQAVWLSSPKNGQILAETLGSRLNGCFL